MNLKKVLMVGIVSLTNYACGPGIDTQNHVEEEAKEHLRKFNIVYGMNVDINIKYSDLPKGVVAYCLTYTFQPNHIEIDKTAFKSYDYYGRENVVFHELGHCVLNRNHDDSEITIRGEKIPTSIMYPHVFGSASFYKENLTYYYKELIKGK